MSEISEAEKRYLESRKRAEELGVFDELKRIDKKLREDRKKQILSKKSK